MNSINEYNKGNTRQEQAITLPNYGIKKNIYEINTMELRIRPKMNNGIDIRLIEPNLYRFSQIYFKRILN